MKMADMYLQELNMEMANTRKSLERIPEDFAWKPHEKSMTLGQLSTHLAEIPDWMEKAITVDEFDMAPPGGAPYQPSDLKTRAEVLAMFDKNLAAARAAMADASDEHLMNNWTLKAGGKALMTMPRTAVVRNFVLNHNIHHRAQLGVYLRLNNVPVPSIYGPSADEGKM